MAVTIKDARRADAAQDRIIVDGRMVLKSGVPEQYRCGLCMVAGREMRVLRLERVRGTMGYRVVCPVCGYEHTSGDSLVCVDKLRLLERIEGLAASQMKDRRKELGVMAKDDRSKAIVAKPASPMMVPKEEAVELRDRISRMMPGMDAFGEMRGTVAGALTQMAMAHNLDPFNQEIWAIPVKKGEEVTGFQMFTGIKGLRRASRSQSSSVTEHRRLTDDEITQRGTHVCPACSGGGKCASCGGSGKWTNPKNGQQGKCFKCDGTGNCPRCGGVGKFEPASGEIVVVETQLWRLDVAAQAKKVGVPYRPVGGFGVWLKGDNVPAGKDAEWVAAKRSMADALRAAYDLPFAYGERVGGPAPDDEYTGDDGEVIDVEGVEVEGGVLASVPGVDCRLTVEEWEAFTDRVMEGIPWYSSVKDVVDAIGEMGIATLGGNLGDVYSRLNDYASKQADGYRQQGLM